MFLATSWTFQSCLGHKCLGSVKHDFSRFVGISDFTSVLYHCIYVFCSSSGARHVKMTQCEVDAECREYCNKLSYMSTEDIERDCRKLVRLHTQRMQDLSDDMHRESKAAEMIDAKYKKYYNQTDVKPESRDLYAALIDHIYKGSNYEEIQELLSQFEQKTRACRDLLLFDSDDETFIVGPAGEHAGMRGEQLLITYAHDIKLMQESQKNTVLRIRAIRKELHQRIRKHIKKSLKGHEQHMCTDHQTVDQAVQHNIEQE